MHELGKWLFKEISDHAFTRAADYFLEVFILVCEYIC